MFKNKRVAATSKSTWAQHVIMVSCLAISQCPSCSPLAPDTAPPSHPPHQAVFWAFKWCPLELSDPGQPPNAMCPPLSHHIQLSQVNPVTSSSPSPPLLLPSGTICWTTSSSFTTGFEVESRKPDFSGNCFKGWATTRTCISPSTLAFFSYLTLYTTLFKLESASLWVGVFLNKVSAMQI